MFPVLFASSRHAKNLESTVTVSRYVSHDSIIANCNGPVALRLQEEEEMMKVDQPHVDESALREAEGTDGGSTNQAQIENMTYAARWDRPKPPFDESSRERYAKESDLTFQVRVTVSVSLAHFVAPAIRNFVSYHTIYGDRLFLTL